jgi:hypothetical protein
MPGRRSGIFVSAAALDVDCVDISLH